MCYHRLAPSTPTPNSSFSSPIQSRRVSVEESRKFSRPFPLVIATSLYHEHISLKWGYAVNSHHEHSDDSARRALEEAEARLAELETEYSDLQEFVKAGRIFLGMLDKRGLASPAAGQQSFLSKTHDFSQLTLTKAAAAYLEEVGTPQKPEAIAQGLVERGFRSEAKDLTSLVRQTLNRRRRGAERRSDTPPIIRMNGAWGLPQWMNLRSKGSHPAIREKKQS